MMTMLLMALFSATGLVLIPLKMAGSIVVRLCPGRSLRSDYFLLVESFFMYKIVSFIKICDNVSDFNFTCF